ncbi:MAG: hypothetical protein JW715_01580 [Sedimentisphaerales bacterium]|nr:hypothetical protein [Sedimentisphaerales bacterium]
MILVIADDISGAAEIAAVGREFGLETQIQIKPATSLSAELVVVDTDTRYRTGQPANDISEALKVYDTAPVDWYYKKVDSVLRGNVSHELCAMMEVLKKNRMILTPENPSKARVISKGRYLIDGLPLHETDFARDPDYPAGSSSVLELLDNPSDCGVYLRTRQNYTGYEQGIVVAEAQNMNDLAGWSDFLDEHTLAAGGSDFFRAILNKKLSPNRIKPQISTVTVSGKKLFVCGSTSDVSKKAVAGAGDSGIPICYMPEELFKSSPVNGTLIKQWADNVLEALKVSDRVIVAILQPSVQDSELAESLRTKTAALVQVVLEAAKIRELFIDGGATAEAVLSAIDCLWFDTPVEYAPGVVQMHVAGQEDKYVTIKPGSYPWPEEIWN